MKRPSYDPKARAKELCAERKRAAAAARMLEEAKLKAKNLEILMGIEEGDRPFWPGSSVHLRVGVIRPMRTIDSIVGRAGLQGDLVASASSYVLDIPNYADVSLTFNTSAHVEFVVGSSSRILGVRSDPSGDWIFIVTLNGEDMSRLGSFAASVDPGAAPWSSPEVTVMIRAGLLAPLRIEGSETLDFVGLVSSLRLGTDSPEGS